MNAEFGAEFGIGARRMTKVQDRLYALRDEKNAAFVAKLIPTVPPERILGARTPALRQLARELKGTQGSRGLSGHAAPPYLEENHLHGFLIEQIRDYEACMAQLERFLAVHRQLGHLRQPEPQGAEKAPAGAAGEDPGLASIRPALYGPLRGEDADGPLSGPGLSTRRIRTGCPSCTGRNTT